MRVFAYLDAGSVSMVLTAVLGGLAGLVATVKMYGKRAFKAIAFWKHDDEQPADAAATVPPTETGEHEALTK